MYWPAAGQPASPLDGVTALQVRLRAANVLMRRVQPARQTYRVPPADPDLITLALGLARTPCGPLYNRHVSPDRELAALITPRRPMTEQPHGR